MPKSPTEGLDSPVDEKSSKDGPSLSAGADTGTSSWSGCMIAGSRSIPAVQKNERMDIVKMFGNLTKYIEK